MEKPTGTHVGFLMSFRISEEDCRRRTVLQISQHSLTLFPLVTHLNYLPTLSSMMTLTWSSLCRLLLISCSSGKDSPWHNNKSGIRPSLPIGLCGHCKTSHEFLKWGRRARRQYAQWHTWRQPIVCLAQAWIGFVMADHNLFFLG